MLATVVCKRGHLGCNIWLMEQSLSMGESETEGIGLGYDILIKYVTTFRLGYEIEC